MAGAWHLENMATLLREYWYLIVVVGVCAVVIVVGLMRDDDTGAPQGTPEEQAAAAEQAKKEAVLRQRLETAPSEARKTPAEKAQITIDEHEATLAADPNSEDAPAVLSALGNKYMSLQQYESAAAQYERIILEFPDWTGTHGIYIQLATCYERLDNQARVQWIYQEMRKVFPEESQEHQFALDKLGLR